MRWTLLLLPMLWMPAAELAPTPAPAGPYRVSANRIIDRNGQPYLIRGTELAPVTLDAVKPPDLGPLSATSLATIRQRLNMNAVRLPLSAVEFQRDGAYRARVAKIVQTANRLELLVILAPSTGDATAAFWTALAEMFHEHPNVFFAAGNAASAAAIRAGHASQPIVVDAAAFPLDDGQIIYQSTPSYTTMRTDADRREQFGSLAEHVPLLVSGLDPHFGEDSAECAAFPNDPAAATGAVEDHLNYFDTHRISWIISAFRPGQLITDTRYFNGTRLDDGWSCGKPSRPVGFGLILLGHLWHTDPHGLFTVNGDAGGFLMARGARAATYGPTLADREIRVKPGQTPPTMMGNVSVTVTDSLGVARLAPLLYVGGGWSLIHFVVPEDAAPGPTEIAVVRTDGSRSVGKGLIADVAPGLRSATSDGRGVAIGLATQKLPGGVVRTFNTFRCTASDCWTVPIPLSKGVTTTLRLTGSGFRHAKSIADFQVTVGEVTVPVLSFGPAASDPGSDDVTVRLTDDLIGYGETDVWMKVGGVLSDVVRLHCGDKADAKVQLGRYLFYDRRMSVNHTTSCATCHRQELAFTDGRAQAKGATGELHPRSAMSLVNLAFSRAFNWSDPAVHSLEEQALKPMFGTAPIELGLGGVRAEFLEVLRRDSNYAGLFPLSFPGQPDPYTIANAAQALAAFERTIASKNSAWDRFHQGDPTAISESAKRGEILFFLDGGPSCFRCHNGPNFTDGDYHNTALYATDGRRFKTPTVRNIALTAPYMHDGSIATLEGVVDHYAAGGRAHLNPGKDKLMHGFQITAQNRADLVEFLRSLTDDEMIHNPAFGDPWSSADQK